MRLFPLLLITGPLASLASLSAQSAPGAELWRLAAVTLPVPAALNGGVAAAFWNPAQRPDGHGWLGLEVIQTPDVVGATGLLAAAVVPLPRVGNIGLVYGRMGLNDLVRTSDSPDPEGPSIPFYSQDVKLVWATSLRGLTLGTGLAYRSTRFDGATIDGWGLDLGLSQKVGGKLRIAASTHGLRRLGNDPGQDVFAGIEYRMWQGALWQGAPGTIRARYGVSAGHPGGVDHQFGAGLEIGSVLTLDAQLAREASYGHAAWRGAAGLRVAVGRYRLTVARDGGVSNLGSAFRVGLEARIR
jgi:hypothetical protein